MLYDIIGVFIQPLSGNGIFAGSDLQYNEENKGLVGRLYDAYGHSEIKGSLDLSKGKMVFDKWYENGKKVINYQFGRKGDLWRGKFKGESVGFGEVMCEIFEVGKAPKYDWENITRNAQLSIGGAKEWAKTLIDEMEQEGYFKIVKDPITGEKIVKSLKRP